MGSANGVTWRLTGFYGFPCTTDRWRSWELLKVLAQSGDDPWLCFGDFNEITSMSEKYGGAVRDERLMQNFRDAISFCGLRDLGYRGAPFTWQGFRRSGLVRERLDRAVACSGWCNIFQNTEVRHLISSSSDHEPILVDTEGFALLRRKKTFFLVRGYVAQR